MQRARSLFSAALLIAACDAIAGCGATVQSAGGGLTASQQLLASQAIDGALNQLEWPNVDRKKIFIEIGTPAPDEEQRYLRSAIAAGIAERGGKVAPDLKSADYVFVVLGKALGIDASQTFFGLPTLQSSLVPVGLPEIPLYKSSRQVGVAKLETLLLDRKRGGILSHPAPVETELWVRDYAVLFYAKRETNTTLLE